MNRTLCRCVPVLCAGLVLILSASAQTAPTASAAPRAQEAFKNLKVLPDNISRDDLRKLMRQFTGDLGVESNSATPQQTRSPSARPGPPTPTRLRIQRGT